MNFIEIDSWTFSPVETSIVIKQGIERISSFEVDGDDGLRKANLKV